MAGDDSFPFSVAVWGGLARNGTVEFIETSMEIRNWNITREVSRHDPGFLVLEWHIFISICGFATCGSSPCSPGFCLLDSMELRIEPSDL